MMDSNNKHTNSGKNKIKSGERSAGLSGKLILFLMPLLFWACGGGQKGGDKSIPDTLQIRPDLEEAPMSEEIQDAVISRDGIGPIKIGMRIVDIKREVKNLYDSVGNQQGYESNSYYFYLKGEQRFTAYEFQPGIVSVLSVDGSNVVVPAGDGDTIRLGDDFAKVLKLKGVRSEWLTADEEGMWCWHGDGLWFMPSTEGLTQDAELTLYDKARVPDAKELSGLKIGYIGTGVPF